MTAGEDRSRAFAASGVRWLIAGLVVRLLLSAYSAGSDDAVLWSNFAAGVSKLGLVEQYRSDPYFNHPPVMAAVAGVLHFLASGTTIGFVFVFRLLPILADVVLWAALARGTGRTWVAGAVALDPLAVLMSAHHTNTDSIHACLTALGVLALSRGRDVRAGLLLGAAVNVKLLPLVVILPLLVALPFRRAVRLTVGGLPWMLPFAVMAWLVGEPFVRHVLGYGGSLNHWGLGWLLAATEPGLAWIGTPLVLAGAVGVGLLFRFRGRGETGVDVREVAAAGAAVFFVITPAVATQYLVLLTPLLYLAAPGWGLAWSLAAGGFCVLLYGANWDGRFPIRTTDTGYFRTAFWGAAALVPWSVAAGAAVAMLSRGVRGSRGR
jgi:hypothetical protein